MQEIKLDLKGLKCPMPILKTKKQLSSLQCGDTLIIYTTDSTSLNDFNTFCKYTGHTLIKSSKVEENDNVYEIIIKHK